MLSIPDSINHQSCYARAVALQRESSKFILCGEIVELLMRFSTTPKPRKSFF